MDYTKNAFLKFFTMDSECHYCTTSLSINFGSAQFQNLVCDSENLRQLFQEKVRPKTFC